MLQKPDKSSADCTFLPDFKLMPHGIAFAIVAGGLVYCGKKAKKYRTF